MLSTSRLVLMQFIFSNRNLIPATVRQLVKTPEENGSRAPRWGGNLFIGPTPAVSLLGLLGDLEEAGFQLVSCKHKPRLDDMGKINHLLRFIFGRPEHSAPEAGFLEKQVAVRADLAKICGEATWQCQVFQNPFFRGEEVVEGAHAISINLNARKPLLDPYGNQLKVWQRDARGMKTGDAPLPVQPARELRIVYKTLVMEPFVA